MKAAADSGWRFEWRRGWDEVFEPAFVRRWEALRGGAAISTPFHHPSVVRAWVDTCGKALGSEPLFGVATRNEITVLLPLVVVTSSGRFVSRRTVEYVGQDLFSYTDPIVVGDLSSVDWENFWAVVRSEIGSAAHLAVMRSVDVRVAAGSAAAAEGAPVVSLEGVSSFESLVAGCSANHRGDLNRRIRRLSEQGALELRIVQPHERSEAAAACDALVAAYAARRERRPEYPSLDRPGLRALWREVATTGVASGWGHLAALHVGGTPVAWHLGLFDADALYWWVPAHAAPWEAFSPGKVLLAMLIEHAIVARWRAIHLLAGTQRYKMAWRPSLPPRNVVRWHAPTIAGSILERYDRRAATL